MGASHYFDETPEKIFKIFLTVNQTFTKKLENFSSKKLENSILNSIFGNVKTNKKQTI